MSTNIFLNVEKYINISKKYPQNFKNIFQKNVTNIKNIKKKIFRVFFARDFTCQQLIVDDKK